MESPVALPTEGVDRNLLALALLLVLARSPSPRRAWIEIFCRANCANICPMSPSPRRAWIEIVAVPSSTRSVLGRPPHGGRG